MALIKIIADNKGQTTSYHRIKSTSLDFDNKVIYVNLAGYTSEQYRTLEKEVAEDEPRQYNVVSTGQFRLAIIDDDFSRENLYARLKIEIPEWADATDSE